MCGIFGAINSKNRTSDSQDLRAIASKNRAAILDSLRNRGEDDEGFFERENCFLAHSRLAIIDPLSRASQPYILGEIALVFNGEIYNYRELAKEYLLELETESDTEVVALLYEKLGDSFVELLDGMFALGIYDMRSEPRLLLARDRAGEKPLYYTQNQSGVAFASTTNALIKSKIVEPRIERQAIWDFFKFLWIPEPATIFKEIFALMPAHTFVFERGKVKISPFNNRFVAEVHNGESTQESIRKMVEKSIRSRLLSDVKVGAFLSGGVDSSIVCALASARIPELETFSVGFVDDFDPYTGYADETKYALAVSKFLDTKHRVIQICAQDFEKLLGEFVRFSDQPFGVVSALGIMCVAKEAKRLGIKVLLSGDGADEIFGGYLWHIKVRNSPLEKNPEKPKGWHYYATEGQKQDFLCKKFFDGCESSLRFLIDDLRAKPKQYLEQDLELYLKNEMMSKLDRMTMACGIEGRAMFVSPELLDFAARIDYEWLLPDEREKMRLKEAFSGLLPREVFARKKHGFNPPINHWMKNEWLGILQESLRENSALFEYEIINRESVTRFWTHFSESERAGVIGFCFVVLNLWLKNLKESV